MNLFIRNHQKIITLYGCYILFIFASLLLKEGDLFYEGGAYKFYVVSMFKDLDFNIINQVLPEQAWLVTKTYYHPDFHPEVQSGFLFPLYCIEMLIQKISGAPEGFWFTLSISALTLNFMSIIFSYHLLHETSGLLGIRNRFSYSLMFYFGTVLLYFSLFLATVLEVFSLPLLSFILLTFVRHKINLPLLNILSVGIAAGFLIISKHTFLPLPLYLCSILLISFYRQKEWMNAVKLVGPILFLLLCKHANQIVKFDFFYNPLDVAGAYVTSFHWADFVNKIPVHLTRGPFLISPISFFATIASFMLLRKLYLRKIFSRLDVSVIAIWIISGIFLHIIVLGPVGEDHIAGRVYLAAAPFLFLGFHDFFSERSSLRVSIFLGILCLWHLLMTYGYLGIASVNYFLYAKQIIPTGELLTQSIDRYLFWLKSNYLAFRNYFVLILLFVTTFTLIGFYISKNKAGYYFGHRFLLLSFLFFLLMTSINVFNGKKNVEFMKQQGVFNDAVVGNGPEIFTIDYILDYLNSLRKVGDERVLTEIDRRIDEFYTRIEAGQIIQSTPEFNEAIRTRSPDHSFWIKMHDKK